jgi:hypothetical protein
MRATKTPQAAACSLRAAKDEVQDALSFSVWQENGTCKAFFLCVAVSDAIKKRGHLDDYEKVAWMYRKAKEVIESARAGLSLLRESVRKSRKEKKKTKEGEKVAPVKATFRVSQTKNSFFLVHRYWGSEVTRLG